MDRRKSIKTLLVGTAVASVLIESCDTSVKNNSAASSKGLNEEDRMAEEKIANKKLSKPIFLFKLTIKTNIKKPTPIASETNPCRASDK
jgi:hypothetical protein